jgi:UDP-glucose 4-epimerase
MCEALKIGPERSYSGGERGWIGDSPFILLETKRIRALGWAPKLTIREGILKTLSYLQANQWLFEGRS